MTNTIPEPTPTLSPLKRIVLGSVALALAAAIWIPSVHFLYQPRLADYYRPEGIAPKARALAARQLEFWSDPRLRAEEIRRMRGSNAEWDFMGRTFLVLALANMSCREPASRAPYLEVIDRIIEETIRLEAEQSMYVFLMDYARNGEWVAKPERSLFVDGEIVLVVPIMLIAAGLILVGESLAVSSQRKQEH